MAKKVNIIPKDKNIVVIPLEEAMPDNYLPYAIEVAKERALPDVRDGLKPVHRRILYGSYLLKAFPDKPYFKSARIVGDILGKFHPHGDSSVYDAMTILAQSFSTREPLMDGHGNWGSVDGDSAAAMRYTEARLSPIAMEMIRDIDKDTVDMVPNYADSELEPKVLPSRYPNLLVNGTFGIAVGLATNIPPHNLGEVTEGVLAYIDNHEITTKELMQYIKGPDLPTGGILIGKNSLLSAYETGEGKVTCRAKTEIQKLENDRMGIVITEFPYKKNKARLLQYISEMTGDKRHAKVLECITDIRDESDRSGTRAVIEFKKSVDAVTADKILKYLFKKTELQCNISFNMVALADGKPQTMSLKTIITHYVNHRRDVVTRRTTKELDIAEKRFHIIEGFIKVIEVLDQVIKTIRESKSKKDAGENLMAQFGFSEAQATAILELMLYRLTGLEITIFEKEYKELEKTIKRLKKILSQDKELLRVIKEELREVSEKFSNARRTRIVEDDSEAKIDIEDVMVIEDVMITLSKDGFIKRVPQKNYIRSNSKPEDIDYREGDELKYLVKSNTKDTFIIFMDNGNMYQTRGVNIPECKWKDKGEKLDVIVKTINLEKEKIVGISSVDVFSPNMVISLFTNKGSMKKSSLDKFATTYSKLQGTKLRPEEKLIKVDFAQDEREFLKVKSKLGLEFTLEIPKLEDSPRNILGTQLFNLSINDEVEIVEYADAMEFVEYTVGVTAKGALKAFGKANKNQSLKVNTDSKSQLVMFTNKGRVIKIAAFLIQEAIKNEVSINNLVNGLESTEKVVALFSLKKFDETLGIYIFTKKGFVKKTILKEFDGDYLIQQAYKFKNKDDEVVSVDIAKENIGHLVMITKKGMAIRFPVNNVNAMGKISSGVTGMSLKDDDEILFAKCFVTMEQKDTGEIAITALEKYKFQIVSKNKELNEVFLSDIKLQNRAGRGNNIIFVLMDDEIKSVSLK
ncbi:DNA topoisomerase IV subunit A [Clostridium vincentii]|uniref:DNA topoisomerase (ATP-hydrolyzing) n=1 Tax=Clostridium vincentii TaxID=52704 RepID=A0A2T0BFY3_9CLOT|nr:DNA topoisomerase IV subunit A [Clostridium vincentii]PRR82811.1 DNA gyrase subunit A [Clostridium vincentii]